jgi:hypothetical protein
MENYEKELYAKLSTPENFTNVLKLQHFFERVLKPEILKDFWFEVRKQLQLRIETDKDFEDWAVFMDDSLDDGLYFYKKSWELNSIDSEVKSVLSFTFENIKTEVLLGLYMQKKFDSNPIRVDRIRERINQIDPDFEFGRRPFDFYLFMDNLPSMDLSNNEGLSKILPVYKVEMATEMVNRITGLARSREKVIDQIVEEIKEGVL